MASLLAIIPACSLFWIWLRRFDAQVFVEHGPMENFQAACLVAGVLLLLWTIRRESDAAHRIFFGGLTLAYLTLIILEVDLRKFDLPVLNRLFNGPVRDAWLGLLWVIAFVVFLRRAREVCAAFFGWLRSQAGSLFVLAGGFWVAAVIIDKLKLFSPRANNLMAEELFECNGALLMVFSAILTWRMQAVNTAPGSPP